MKLINRTYVGTHNHHVGVPSLPNKLCDFEVRHPCCVEPELQNGKIQSKHNYIY